MPRYKKPGTGRDFKPGHVANPSGRPPTSPELKSAKKLTAQLFQDSVNKLTQMNIPDLQKYMHTAECSALEAMIIGQIQSAIKGKSTPIGLLLDRTIGPIQHQFKVAVSGDLEVRNATLTQEQADQETLKVLKRIRARIGSNTPGAT